MRNPLSFITAPVVEYFSFIVAEQCHVLLGDRAKAKTGSGYRVAQGYSVMKTIRAQRASMTPEWAAGCSIPSDVSVTRRYLLEAYGKASAPAIH